MDAKRFDALLRALTDRSSRRGIVRTLTSLGLAAMLGAGTNTEAAAMKCPPCRKKKHGKCKRRKPNGTPCEDSRGICDRGSCACGDGPTCPPRQVCVAGKCFPQGTCPPGTRACVPATGTTCGDDCFCGLSAEGTTVCIESGGVCVNFPGCETAAECSNCQSSADCAIGEACIDFSGCCEGVLRPDPVPVGTKYCASPCFDSDA